MQRNIFMKVFVSGRRIIFVFSAFSGNFAEISQNSFCRVVKTCIVRVNRSTWGKINFSLDFFFTCDVGRKKLLGELCRKFSTSLSKLHSRFNEERFEENKVLKRLCLFYFLSEFEENFNDFLWKISDTVGRTALRCPLQDFNEFFFRKFNNFFIDERLWHCFVLFLVTTFWQGAKKMHSTCQRTLF